MTAETRAKVHRELDGWLDRVESRILRYEDGSYHSLNLEAAFAGYDVDDQLVFEFMIERSEKVSLP